MKLSQRCMVVDTNSSLIELACLVKFVDMPCFEYAIENESRS
jgi:hypothetical protein